MQLRKIKITRLSLSPSHSSVTDVESRISTAVDCQQQQQQQQLWRHPKKPPESPLNVLRFQKPQVFLSLAAHPAIMPGSRFPALNYSKPQYQIIPARHFSLWLYRYHLLRKTFRFCGAACPRLTLTAGRGCCNCRQAEFFCERKL